MQLVLDVEWFLKRRLQTLQPGMHQGQRLSMLGLGFISAELDNRKSWRVCELRVTHVLCLSGLYLESGLVGRNTESVNRKRSPLYAMTEQGRGVCRSE